MSNIRKLSAFRQLSLNCDSPTPEQRRKTFKKQFSEDIPDDRDHWLEQGIGIKISLNAKSDRNLDRPPQIKIAWEENAEIKTEEAVIIKKCKEVRRTSTGKLSRQNSVEKDSILHSKQELTERLRQVKEKEQEKPNLQIFLAHNTKEQKDEYYSNQIDVEETFEKITERPKLIQPLITNNVSNNKNLFQIRRNVRSKINLNEIAYSPTRPSEKTSFFSRSNTVVVVPIVEKEERKPKQDNVEDTEEESQASVTKEPSDDMKVIIRPSTAASKREKFQKRTNSAFNANIKETRPKLIRSSSAPSKPEHHKAKFLNKKKIKTVKRPQIRSFPIEKNKEDVSNKENPKNQKKLNRITAVNGNEVVTMVSLVSPAGSDAEEEVVEEKEKLKNGSNATNNKMLNEEKEVSKNNVSMRKVVKTVSFQQSTIHAIRSFSASFPARRGSVAACVMSGNNSKSVPQQHGSKGHEKRSTNSSTPDDDERVPKRRLVRSNTEITETISCEQLEEIVQSEPLEDVEKLPTNSNFTVAVKSKNIPVAEELVTPDIPSENADANSTETEREEEKVNEPVKYKTPKEKQCWDLYCKMADKGINISFDTILRGMLTPTEYRLSRKNSVVAPVAEESTEATNNC